jgi:hypothetical protein
MDESEDHIQINSPRLESYICRDQGCVPELNFT